jgi:DNA repair protein RadC
MSNAHLLGILNGSKVGAQKNAVDLIQELLSAFVTLENLSQATGTETCQLKDIGMTKGDINKYPAGGGKAHSFKAYRSED